MEEAANLKRRFRSALVLSQVNAPGEDSRKINGLLPTDSAREIPRVFQGRKGGRLMPSEVFGGINIEGCDSCFGGFLSLFKKS